MRKSKNRAVKNSGRTVSPYPTSFDRVPKNLKREATTPAQKNAAEDTIIWGIDDAFPLRLAHAIQQSPATTACLDTRAQFIKGAGFSDKTIMRQRINQYGETLWQLHCKLANMLSYFRGFAVNLKYNAKGRILMAYDMPFENIRFVKPKNDLVTHIDKIKYNPYFGTDQYKKDYTKEYPLFDAGEDEKERLRILDEQMSCYGDAFPGNVYYYGKTSPLYRFYPMPEYWSAEQWIQIDGKIQNFHLKNLSNGFFQSVLMNIIGDPNAMSKNPKYQVEYTDTEGNKRTKSTKTVGEEFTEMMSEAFSGDDKAGNVMALWSLNTDTAAKINPFPANTNAGLFDTLQNLTTKNITIATKTPSILANISEGVSLGSAGSEIQKAIELMQSNVVEDQQTLEDFYNNVLLPGMGITTKVEILNFNPVTEKPEIDDKVWEWLSDSEKKEWVGKNLPEITITRVFAEPVTPTATLAPGVTPPTEGEPAPAQSAPAPTGNSALANINIAQLNKIQKIVSRFNMGLTDPANPKALTFEQAKQFLASFGFTDEEVNAWLVKPEEIE